MKFKVAKLIYNILCNIPVCFCLCLTSSIIGVSTYEDAILTINFNMPVEYVASNGNLINGNGSAVLQIKFTYHQNPNDNIGMGDLIIKADSGLSVVSVNITD